MISLKKWLNITKYIGFSQTHFDIFIILVKNSVFFLQNIINNEVNVLKYTDKKIQQNGGGGVRKMLTMADKGGKGGWGKC